MTTQTQHKFEIPTKAVSEAAAAMQKKVGHTIDLYAYAASAQVLLAALVEQGWTIAPPNEAAYDR